jgi:type 1 glutamine amidotransferase
MQMIAQNSGAFEIVLSKDITVFEKDQLSKFDVVLLNNNCSRGERRDLFWDVFNKDASLNEQQKIKKANQLEKNLIQFVKKGKGLVLLHGGIVMQNNSLEFSDMVGGSFDYHPPQQEVHVKLVDPNHPLVNGFDPEGFIHYDEPYFFKNAYFRYNFRPLLYLELDKIKMKRPRPNDKIKYISWIKRHGRGRVFYSSPSHNAQSYENPELLQFLYNGLLYAAGFVDCDDSAIKKRLLN